MENNITKEDMKIIGDLLFFIVLILVLILINIS